MQGAIFQHDGCFGVGGENLLPVYFFLKSPINKPVGIHAGSREVRFVRLPEEITEGFADGLRGIAGAQTAAIERESEAVERGGEVFVVERGIGPIVSVGGAFFGGESLGWFSIDQEYDVAQDARVERSSAIHLGEVEPGEFAFFPFFVVLNHKTDGDLGGTDVKGEAMNLESVGVGELRQRNGEGLIGRFRIGMDARRER